MGDTRKQTPHSLEDTGTYVTDVRLAPDAVALESGADTWDAITPFMESFLDVWEKEGGEPTLSEHLPEEPAVLRRLTWVELVKIDLEYRYQGDKPRRRLDDYLDDFPEGRDADGPPADLIFEEYHLRREAGEEVSAQEYLDKYPERQGDLGRLLSMDAPNATTSLCRQAMVDVKAGDRLGDFELMLPLGKGAFGSVFLARQVSMQRLVALKISSDHGSEPQTLAQLDHPYIVRVYDQHNLPERQLRLMYLQYVPGGTVEGVLKRAKVCPAEERDGQLVVSSLEEQFERTGGIVQLDEVTRARLRDLSWPELVCRWGAQLAESLDYAHSHNVLHRDVKPANVLLAADGTPKLADFNVSFSSELSGVTAGAFFGGSLAYMSPEQLDAFDPGHERQPDELDGRADLYSLAVLLWELLTGERPFASEAMYENWSDTIASLRVGRANGVDASAFPASDECMKRLTVILARCLEADRERRYASGGELAQALWLCLQPRAAKLLEKPTVGWRRFCARYSVLAVALAVLIPNALAGVFNYAYNYQEIIRHLPDAEAVFERVQMGINLIAFPFGIGLVAWYFLPIPRRLRGRESDEVDGREEGVVSRARSLRLGRFVAWVVVGLWAIAGVAYPVVLTVFEVDMGVREYVHFFASLVYCGVLAAVFPCLLVNLLALRVFYPALLDEFALDENGERDFDGLGQRSSLALLLAGAMPALGILAIVVTSLYQKEQGVMPQLVLSVVGVFGFALAFLLYRTIQRDVVALTAALRRADRS